MADNVDIDPAWLEALAQLCLTQEGTDWVRFTTIGTGPEVLASRIVAKRQPDSCIYTHIWHRSDPDALHDHPWDSCSLVLKVGYWEETPDGRFWRPPGSVVFRKAEDRHRIIVEPSGDRPVSLFITGIERREWGFHTPDGWIVGREYRSQPHYEQRQAMAG